MRTGGTMNFITSTDSACLIQHQPKKRLRAMLSTTALSASLAITATLSSPAFAAQSQATAQGAPTQNGQGQAVEEVVVTGSRIVREGYEAPTPLSVIGTEALENKADANIANLLAQMPVFSGSGLGSTNSISLSTANSGQNNLNLRSMGVTRTLVLLDGQRTVGSSASGQTVDINSYPQQLLSRVDVVTGGASAVYGSDAVAGVVNFILDKQFTGVKGEVSGGMTNFGDGKNISLKVSAGFGFADNRGHVLLSGEENFNGGSKGDGGREWNRTGTQIMVNPAYGTGAGQTTSVPAQLILDHVGVVSMSYGGIVNAGPLKGLAFGQNGVPYQFKYGTLTNSTQTQGGDWASTEVRQGYDMIQKEHRQNLFFRAAYDVTDSLNVFVQSSWTQSRDSGFVDPGFAPAPGAAAPIIKLDNAFLPATVRASMVANNLTQIQVGEWNTEVGWVFADNTRITNQNSIGAEGNFDAFGSNWKWNAYGAYGVTRALIHYANTFITARYLQATDSVVNPATGGIVCRVKLTDPSNPCQPWNPLGIGVNAGNTAGRAFIVGDPSASHGKVEQGVFAATVTGEPFSVPAGPVSLAISAEHRIESVHNQPDTPSLTISHIQGNPGILNGKQSVTEGALETVVPIVKGASWAENWDFNGAVRFTGYELAGYVTTWKVGTTFTPIDDIKFRFTQSRDIRAPNLAELFQPSSVGFGVLQDPFTNTNPSPTSLTQGNPNLTPEKANETGIGVVLSPRFLDGFTGSVDYWRVNLSGGIGAVSTQNIINFCYNGVHPVFCSRITRVNGVISQVTTGQINIAQQDMRGLDVEATYRFKMADMLSSMNGDFTLHGNLTLYLKNYQNDSLTTPTNHVGENGGGGGTTGGPPNWRMTMSATYALDPVTFTLTARAMSSGLINSEYIECTSACPVSTAAHITVNNNRLPGAFYLDANVNYAFNIASASTVAFFSVRNMLNHNPPGVPTSPNYANLAIQASGLYDIQGAVFRAGLRFKM